MISTWAPATTAPVTSVTVPVIAPVAPPCATATAESVITARVTTTKDLRFDIHGPLPRYDGNSSIQLGESNQHARSVAEPGSALRLGRRCPTCTYSPHWRWKNK